MLSEPAGEDSISPEALERFAAQLLQQTGASQDIASQVARSLVLSDIRGHNSHGTRRIPSYVKYALEGQDSGYTIDASATPVVASEGPTHASVDGRNAFGQVVGRKAVDVAAEKAEENGVAMVGVRNATHLGRIGEWSERAAERGMLFAAYVYNHSRSVAPPGSADRRYSTNPISYGIPTFDALEFPIMLDIATSQVAGGKTAEFAARGDSMNGAWTITENGSPVTDAEAFRDGEGALLPLGGLISGYKGFGLAMIAELFGGITADAPVHGGTDFKHGCAAMFVTADPTLFTTQESIQKRVTALRDYIADTEFSSAVPNGDVAYEDKAVLPGESEHIIEQIRRERGIPLPRQDIESLCELAVAHDIQGSIPPAFDRVVPE